MLCAASEAQGERATEGVADTALLWIVGSRERVRAARPLAEPTLPIAHGGGVLVRSAAMTFVPPDPHRTLRVLQEALADLRQLAALSSETRAYADAATQVEEAIAKLEATIRPAAR